MMSVNTDVMMQQRRKIK